MIATDGWKRRIAAGGAPLMNVMLLFPDGGSSFFDVENVAGVTKDAAWVTETPKDIAARASPENPEKVGVCAYVFVFYYHVLFGVYRSLFTEHTH